MHEGAYSGGVERLDETGTAYIEDGSSYQVYDSDIPDTAKLFEPVSTQGLEAQALDLDMVIKLTLTFGIGGWLVWQIIKESRPKKRRYSW